MSRLKVLALSPFPVEAAATRFRLVQLRGALGEHGVDLEVHPFLDSDGFSTFYRRSAWKRTAVALVRASGRRVADVRRARRADVLLVLREAAVLGPPLFEWLSLHAGRAPMVLDLDDATYVTYVSPTYGRLATVLKWPGKTDQLIRWARLATCGNQVIADYVSARGTPTRVVPTVVDTDVFRPRDPDNDPPGSLPTVGWIGTHSTFPFLESLSPVLEDLGRHHRYRLTVVGSGRDRVMIPGVEVENRPWALDREAKDFRSLDIGLYPLVEDRWSAGKSGLKSIQYMAVGIPFVASPVGAAGELGEAGTTHFAASEPGEWRKYLGLLLDDPALRRRMGAAGRAHVLGRYTVAHAARALAEALHDAAS
ncbi:MAG TPA: glycosyltransferase [Acidimicrobiales bacterium]|nr:glycosyltransferase [Acidimicrobiales bacterium]